MTTQKRRGRFTMSGRIGVFGYNPDQLRWPKGTRWGGRWMDMPWKIGGDWLKFWDGEAKSSLSAKFHNDLDRKYITGTDKDPKIRDLVEELDGLGLEAGPDDLELRTRAIHELAQGLQAEVYRSPEGIEEPWLGLEVDNFVRNIGVAAEADFAEWQKLIDAQNDTSGIGEWGEPAFSPGADEDLLDSDLSDEEIADMQEGRDMMQKLLPPDTSAPGESANSVNGVTIPPAGTDPSFDPNSDELWVSRPWEVEKALEAQGYVFDYDVDEWVTPGAGGGSGDSGGSGGSGGDGDSAAADGPDPRKVLADIEKRGWGPGGGGSDASTREFYRDFSDEELQAVLDADLEGTDLDPRILQHVRGAIAQEQARRNGPEARVQKILKQLRGMSVGDLEQAGREGGPDLEEMFEGFTDAELERVDKALELSLQAGVEYQKTSAQQDAVNRELDRRRKSPKDGSKGDLTPAQVDQILLKADSEAMAKAYLKITGKPMWEQGPTVKSAQAKWRKLLKTPEGRLQIAKQLLEVSGNLTASAYAPAKPPVAFFKNPQLTEPTPMTVTPEGRVYGHVALWDTCHVGNPEGPAKCTQPPRSKSNYAYFHVGAVETAEGNEVAVGKLVQGTIHADTEATAMQALAHYENTGLAVADVRAGEDRFGIWVSGALRHDLTDGQVKEFRAAPMSGDWRRMRGSLELVAALAVNVPGFPVPRPNGFVASGHVQSLVASGMVPPRKVKAPGSPGALSSEDLQYLKSLAARERANHAAQLATKVQEVKEADQIKKIKAFAERQRTRKG